MRAAFILVVAAWGIGVAPAGTSVVLSGRSDAHSVEWKAWLDAQAIGFSGVVLIGRGDVIELEAAYGPAEPERNRSNNPDTRFNLGSINKTFTAVAIAQLIQQGRLSLDDTLANHLPEYPNKSAAARITIRDLLTHRSGVAQFRGADFGDVSVAEMVKRVAAEPQAFEPHARQEYSNGGYVVLGRVIEVISGQTYPAYVADRIYRPAGMTATGFFRNGDREDNVAWPLAAPTSPRPRTGNPAGGGYSTAADLFRFSRALRGGGLLNKRLTDYLLNGTFSEQPRFGFALREQVIGSHRFIGNGGGAPGVNAEFRFEPSGAYTVVVLANTSPPAATELLTAILNRIAATPAGAVAAVKSTKLASFRSPSTGVGAEIQVRGSRAQRWIFTPVRSWMTGNAVRRAASSNRMNTGAA